MAKNGQCIQRIHFPDRYDRASAGQTAQDAGPRRLAVSQPKLMSCILAVQTSPEVADLTEAGVIEPVKSVSSKQGLSKGIILKDISFFPSIPIVETAGWTDDIPKNLGGPSHAA